MRYLFGLALLAFLAWCGWWFVASSAQRTAWEHLIATQQDQGRVAAASIEIAGFPNRLDTTLSDLVFEDPASGWGWKAPFFQVLMLSYKPNHVIAAWPNDQQIKTPLGPLAITSEKLLASAVFVPDTQLGLDRFNVEGGELKASGWLRAALPRILINAQRVSEQEPERYGVILEATEPVLPGPRGAELELDLVRGDATVIFDAPLDRHALTGPAPLVDALDLRSLRLERDGQSLEAAGRLEVDAAGFLSGDVQLAFSTPALLPEFLAVTGLAEQLDPLVQLALSRLATQSGPLTVGMVFRDGQTLLGPLRTRVGPAPRLR